MYGAAQQQWQSLSNGAKVHDAHRATVSIQVVAACTADNSVHEGALLRLNFLLQQLLRSERVISAIQHYSVHTSSIIQALRSKYT